MSNIYEKLQSARIELQSKKLKKSGHNKLAGYDYYELSDFLPSVNTIFANLKLFSNFSILENTATLTIIDSEDNTQTIVFTSPIAELELKSCNKVQALGGIHTYLKRYLYQNALEIVEDDMFDSVTGNPVRDQDTDLLLGIEAAVSTDEVQRFYNQHKDSAKNLDAFKIAYAKRYTKLKAQEKKDV